MIGVATSKTTNGYSYLYNVTKQTFQPVTYLDEGDFMIINKKDNNLGRLEAPNSLLTKEERLFFMENILTCINEKFGLRIVEIHETNDNKLKIIYGSIITDDSGKLKFTTKTEEGDMFYFKIPSNQVEKICKVFRYLVGIAERIDAINNRNEVVHKQKQKQVNAELECMPNFGSTFQQCKEDFESRQ